MSRTTSIKNLDESYVFAVVESSSQHFAQVAVSAAGTVTIIEKDAYDASNIADLVVFPKYGLGSASGTLTIGDSSGDTLEFTAHTPPNLGQVIATPEAATGDYFSIAGGTAGDTYEIYLAPTSYTSSDEMDWITDFSADAIEIKRNIMQRGYTSHRKRIFNTDKKISVTMLYSNADANLLSLSGNDYTMIAETQDDDAGITTETTFIFGCYHDAGMPSGSVGDTDSTVALNISYQDFCVIDGDGN